LLAVKRLSIEVSDALHQRAKFAALTEGQTLSSLVIELLNGYLQARTGAAPGHPRRRLSDYPMPSHAHPERRAQVSS